MSELFLTGNNNGINIINEKLFYPILLLVILIVETCLAIAYQGWLNNSPGKPVYAPPIGGIVKDKLGQAVCGGGQCLVNSPGNIVYSSQVAGYSLIDGRGRVLISGGCVPASAALCPFPKNNVIGDEIISFGTT